MSDFQKEFDQRMRRVCGVTDDTLEVSYSEEVQDSYWSGDPLDTMWPAEYSIHVFVYREVGLPRHFRTEGVAQKSFSSMEDFLNAVMAVEL